MIICGITIIFIPILDLIVVFLFKKLYIDPAPPTSVVELNNLLVYKYSAITIINIISVGILYIVLSKNTIERIFVKILFCLGVFIFNYLFVRIFL